MPLRVLVSGFEPFDHSPYNPSGEAARALDGTHVTALSGGRQRSGNVLGRVLPVLWNVAGNQLVQLIRTLHPHIVISTGMAAGTFRVEQQADDAWVDHRDNHRRRPRHPRTSPTRFRATSLPVAAIEQAIRTAGGNATPSTNAGGFICDNVFLALMDAFYSSSLPMRMFRAGFIHVPNDTFITRPGFVSSQQGAIPQSTVNAAIRAAVEATIADLSDAEYQQTQP